jgi:hypothetical protein
LFWLLILPVNLIANRLKVSTGVGGHGVIGLLEGKRDGPRVAWRADNER